MRHPFLGAVATGLAAEGIATLRYQFPYMEQGRKRPDPPHLLEATVHSAVVTASELLPGTPLIAGGKSLGGRMTSNAAAGNPLTGVIGLVFLGFPLHPPGRPADSRARHLDAVPLPMLFLQGTRDGFAQLDLIEGVCQRLGSRASLHLIDGGDHSFNVLKRSGRTSEEVLDELAAATSSWIDGLL